LTEVNFSDISILLGKNARQKTSKTTTRGIMSDNLKSLIDKVLYAVAVVLLLIFIMGLVFSVSNMPQIALWFMIFVGAAVAGLATYEYLWRNKDKTKDKMLLMQMIATVLVTLLIIMFACFVLNGKWINLP